MIKRRFFRQDHGDNSVSSSSSSGSDSDSDRVEEEVADKEEVEEQQEDQEEQEAGGEESGEEEELELLVQEESSGYQSEDSSGHDVDGPSLDDDSGGNAEHIEPSNRNLLAKKAACGETDSTKDYADNDEAIDSDFANFILKCKSVYKCKLCPRIICLNKGMVWIHLKSKRHARSKKLFNEGRLKLMLNSDGELEEEQETHAERHARTLALAQQVTKVKKDSGRQRQNRRRKKRARKHQEKKQETPKSEKKRRKTEG